MSLKSISVYQHHSPYNRSLQVNMLWRDSSYLFQLFNPIIELNSFHLLVPRKNADISPRGCFWAFSFIVDKIVFFFHYLLNSLQNKFSFSIIRLNKTQYCKKKIQLASLSLFHFSIDKKFIVPTYTHFFMDFTLSFLKQIEFLLGEKCSDIRVALF